MLVGYSLDEISDYVALIALSNPPAEGQRQPDSILSMFDRPRAAEARHRLTQQDRALLAALYKIPLHRSAASQRRCDRQSVAEHTRALNALRLMRGFRAPAPDALPATELILTSCPWRGRSLSWSAATRPPKLRLHHGQPGGGQSGRRIDRSVRLDDLWTVAHGAGLRQMILMQGRNTGAGYRIFHRLVVAA